MTFKQNRLSLLNHCIILKTNINDIFIHMLTKYGVPQDIKCKKTKIVGFRYKIEDINYVFACDPNDVNKISFKEIKILCEKNNIPLKMEYYFIHRIFHQSGVLII